jgi:acetate CoA/acetoacetate CoA-transferase alpha subunit
MIDKKILTADQAIALIKPGQTVMIGGFMGCGTPPQLIKSLEKSGVDKLTLVSNDCGWYSVEKEKATGTAINVVARQFSHVITSHIGLNPEMQRQMLSRETEVTLVPQGTLAERIRAAGCGLGGVLTPTGVGTEVEEGKQVLELDGTKYLLERGLKGDVALIHAIKADKSGNLIYARSARNFCPLMAMACDLVIVEAEEIVEVGELDPECVITPSLFVNVLVAGEKGGEK